MKSPLLGANRINRNIPVLLVSPGCFNPPHLQHLRNLELARDGLRRINYRVVGGIMTPTHDHYKKHKKTLIEYEHRATMVDLTCQSSSWVKGSRWEGGQPTWTRTAKVLDALQSQGRIEYNEPNLITKLVCGADLLESFAKPGLWLDSDIKTIVGEHGIVVIARPGYDPGSFIFNHDVLFKYQDNITLVYNPVNCDLSSTQCRTLVRRDMSVRYLCTDAVCDYIVRNNLYVETESKGE